MAQSVETVSKAPTYELTKSQRRAEIWRRVKKHKALFFILLPGFLYLIVYKYFPMLGLVISFQDYKPYHGILGSEWVGFEHFQRLFTDPDFWMILRNTLALFSLQILIAFPIPIVLALMLNEVRHKLFQRSIQTMIYIPHFMSWVIIVSISYVMFTVDGGIVNEILAAMGFEKVNFLLSKEWFRPMYIAQEVWKGAGWGTIIYLAAISGVDPDLYEAARMDGANRFQQIWHITIPAIWPTIVVLLILKIGDVLELGFEHVYLLLNASNRSVGEIFDTYVYTTGLIQGQFSYSSAVGMFKGLVGLILVVFANKMAKRYSETGIY